MNVKNYIGGRWQDARDKQTLDLIDPASAEVYGSLPSSKAGDANDAVAAANEMANSWKKITNRERSRILMEIAAGIKKRSHEFALAETKDTGKPLSLTTKVDIPRSINNFEFFAGAAEHFASESYHDPDFLNYTRREPLGVVACIAPWNLPLYLLTWKIAPALAAGNTVVCKPSEVTPVTAHLLSEVLSESSLPDGVVNVLHGLGGEVGEALITHKDVKAISFTGSTATGQQIASLAAPHLKKVSLELGGKNPFIVLEDADLERAAQEAARAAFTNQGQICLCGSRLLVSDKIYDEFMCFFLKAAKSFIPNDPLEPSTNFGSLVSRSHFEKVLAYLDKAQKAGGDFLLGGQPIKLVGRLENGFFVPPTVIAGLSADHCINQEEIFGPVVSVQKFESLREAAEIANDTPYGLAASIWTDQQKAALTLGETLEFGMIWVNCWMKRDLRTPFGGMKASGMGREGGFDAMRFMTEAKNIGIFYGE